MSKSLSTGNKNVTRAFAGVAGLTLIGGGALIFVMNGRIHAEQSQEAALATQVGSSEQVAKRLQSTQADYDETRGKIAFLEASVSQKSYVPTLLQQLQSLAASSQLFMTSVQPSEIVTPAPPTPATTGSDTDTKKAAPLPYNTMGVSVSITGSYAGTQRFLYGLTHFPKILAVSSVQMSPSASGPAATAAASVTTNLRLTAYVFPDEGDDAAAPAVGTGTATPTAANVVPPAAAPTPAGAAGRAATAAVAATRAANAHGTEPARAL